MVFFFSSLSIKVVSSSIAFNSCFCWDFNFSISSVSS
nr:MAG TPA: hypothetical protein [Caudoviricetes sp.]